MHAIELCETETEEEGVTEDQIDDRIEEMDYEEIIYGIATGVRLMKEEPDPEAFTEDAFEPGDMFEEIDRFLRDQDQS